MNLQVSMPYEVCPFKCPMCVANGRKTFDNIYKSHKEMYLRKLASIKAEEYYSDYVITGASDPTLNSHWLKDVLRVLKDVPTELQTKNYNINPDSLPNLNVLAYSITNSKEYLGAWDYPKLTFGINRIVVLLTKDLDFLTPINFNSMGYDQVTFKVLQPTADEKTNKWIKKNRMTNLKNIYKIVDKFNGDEVSVRLDSSCQDSHGRYQIFRANGTIYDRWDEE